MQRKLFFWWICQNTKNVIALAIQIFIAITDFWLCMEQTGTNGREFYEFNQIILTKFWSSNKQIANYHQAYASITKNSFFYHFNDVVILAKLRICWSDIARMWIYQHNTCFIQFRSNPFLYRRYNWHIRMVYFSNFLNGKNI